MALDCRSILGFLSIPNMVSNSTKFTQNQIQLKIRGKLSCLCKKLLPGKKYKPILKTFGGCYNFDILTSTTLFTVYFVIVPLVDCFYTSSTL